MRKIICLLGAVAVLVCCALPAFASTDGEGTMYYTPLLFDTINGVTATGDVASRFEWLFGFGQIPTENTVYFSLGAGGYSSQVRDGEYYGQISMARNTGLDGFLNLPYHPKYELKLREKVIQPFALDDYELRLYNMPNTLINSCRITVTTQMFSASGDGSLNNISISSGVTYTVNSNTLRIGHLLHETLKGMTTYNKELMYISVLDVTFTLSTEPINKVEFRVVSPWNGLNTNPPTMMEWVRTQRVVLPSDSFEVGSFLGTSVSNFMSTPIFNDFTFGHLLGISLTLGVLFFALKLLV